MAVVVIEVPGIPVAKARGRVGTFPKKGGGVRGGIFPDEKTQVWEYYVAWHARLSMGSRAPLACALSFQLDVLLPPPTSWAPWKQEAALAGHIVPSVKPDLDNFQKAAKDALNSIVWVDDALVCDAIPRKRYSQWTGLRIEVDRMIQLPASVATKREYQEWLATNQEWVAGL